MRLNAPCGTNSTRAWGRSTESACYAIGRVLEKGCSRAIGTSRKTHEYTASGDGLRGMRFVAQAVESSRRGAQWVDA